MDIKALEKGYEIFKNDLTNYTKIYEYLKGSTDAMKNYKFITERTNLKVNINFVKKFITEETSYTAGNKANYTDINNDKTSLKAIVKTLRGWREEHDSDLLNEALTYGRAWELYYRDDEENLQAIIETPKTAFMIKDGFDRPLYFVRMYEQDTKTVVEVFDKEFMYKKKGDFTLKGINFKNMTQEAHGFNDVPVSECEISKDKHYFTIYNDIKGLQDAYETNLSDIVNEISDFRNAYLTVKGASFEDPDKDLPKMKSLGILQNGEWAWLTKNINDSFIQNTLKTLEDKMYQITAHINTNEKLQSNLSGAALRSRMLSLEQKCSLNGKALINAMKRRLKFIFYIENMLETAKYDWRDIDISIAPNIPMDDNIIADIITKIGDTGIVSKETLRKQISFVDNPETEAEKVKSENATIDIGGALLEQARKESDVIG
jgi:SPP1 family phage portal protein